MLILEVKDAEAFDERNQRFVTLPGSTLELEHSLISLSKWESKWRVPFLDTQDKTEEQLLDYIKLMNLAPNTPETVFNLLTKEDFHAIFKYITDVPTATTFPNSPPKRGQRERVTAELIYYWMSALSIPFQPAENWHLERLLTLIRIANLKQNPPKRSRGEIMAEHRRLNAERRRQYETNG